MKNRVGYSKAKGKGGIIEKALPKKKTRGEEQTEYAIEELNKIMDDAIKNIGHKKELNGYRGSLKTLLLQLAEMLMKK